MKNFYNIIHENNCQSYSIRFVRTCQAGEDIRRHWKWHLWFIYTQAVIASNQSCLVSPQPARLACWHHTSTNWYKISRRSWPFFQVQHSTQSLVNNKVNIDVGNTQSDYTQSLPLFLKDPPTLLFLWIVLKIYITVPERAIYYSFSFSLNHSDLILSFKWSTFFLHIGNDKFSKFDKYLTTICSTANAILW